MIIRIFLTVMFVFCLTIEGFSQKNDTSRTHKGDSLLTHQGINPRLNVYYDFNEFVLPFKMNYSNPDLLFSGDSSTLWMRTELALQYSPDFGKNTFNINNGELTAPLFNQYLQQSKFDPVRYILGMAQAAAAGYLAYRHIKKYGFWK